MDILRADVSDATEILSLQKLAYISEAEIYNDFNIPPLTQTLEEVLNKFKDHIFLKAVEEGKIVGSVRANILDSGAVYIGRLIVHPEYQNQGIGTRLMDTIETCFPGIKIFELMTGFKSQKNISFYEKRGYKIFKKEKFKDDLLILYMEKFVR